MIIFFGLGIFQTKAQSSKTISENFANGKVKTIGRVDKNEQKTGIWLIYFETGKLYRKEKWNQGKLKWSVEYNEFHKKVSGTNSKGKVTYFKGCNCKS